MPEPDLKPTRRYAAFLSYRHADNREEGRRWAEWLHQALETYEVPRDLAGKPNLRGTPVPGSLYPVFRDEEELPADADLTQNIRRALENSDLLIVLCSPRACESRFVDDEIRYFKELGKSDRILALMLDGEPNADDPAKAAQGITPDMECLPEALRCGVPVEAPSDAPALIDWTKRTEPIAADVRPQNRPVQGCTSAAAYRTALEKARAHSAPEIRRLEKAFANQLDLARLKLAAGALGVPLGQLRDRDAVHRARKFRRAAVILGTLTLLALIAAGVAVWQRAQAVKQEQAARRNEIAARAAEADATRQKARAETGEQNAVEAKERAVASKQAADELIRFMQYDLRDKLGTVGRLDMMEDINTRVRRYHDAHPPEPGDQAAQDADDRERSVALEERGNILLAQGDLAGALRNYQEDLGIARRLAAKDPGNGGWQRDVSVSLNKVSDAQQAQGDLAGALKSCQESLRIVLGLAARDPDNADWQRDVSVSLNKIGDVQRARGDLTAALKSCQGGLTISRRLAAKAPGNIDRQRDVSVNLSKIGDVQRAQGDLAAALKTYQEDLGIARQLAAREPGNAGRQRDASVSLNEVGNVQQTQGDLAGALASYQEGLDIARQLASRDPGNADWRRDVSVSLNKVGGAQQAQKDLAGALTSYREGLDIARQLTAKDPANADRQRDVLASLSMIGGVQHAQGDLSGALNTYQEELDIARQLAAREPGNGGWQLDLAYSERNVGTILLKQNDRPAARTRFELYREIVDRLAVAHPGSYVITTDRASARWLLAGCTDQQDPTGKAESRRFLGEAAGFLHALEKSPGLQPRHANWLKQIETELKASELTAYPNNGVESL